VELTAAQGRVLGALVEKERTTPQGYPLTDNALLAACNQTTSRDPVVSYDVAAVRLAVRSLREQELLRTVHRPGERSEKHRHELAAALELSREHVVVLALLLLRGPQTAAEVRARAARMHPMSGEDVERVLGELDGRPEPLAVRLERQPGRKEARWAQRLAAGGPTPSPAQAPAPALALATAQVPAPDGAEAELRRYLQGAREAVLWKLEGLSEYDVRRPLTPTGTNLLGLVKHVASVEAGYLGDCFGRPFPVPMPWFADGAEPNADMWAAPEESREQVLELHRKAAAHGDATIEALPLDAVGRVPWWRPGSQDVTLQRVLVHLIAETHRHAGHADVVRELVDGAAGLRAGAPNLPDVDWAAHRDQLEEVAREV
jgi:uncharacterized protein YceH (UPF0502 family)